MCPDDQIMWPSVFTLTNMCHHPWHTKKVPETTTEKQKLTEWVLFILTNLEISHGQTWTNSNLNFAQMLCLHSPTSVELPQITNHLPAKCS